MANRVLDQWLHDEARHRGIERRRVDVVYDVQTLAKARLLNLEIRVDELELLAKRDIARPREHGGHAQQVTQARDHAIGARRIHVNELRDDVKGVEQKMRIELRPEDLELRPRELRLQTGRPFRQTGLVDALITSPCEEIDGVRDREDGKVREEMQLEYRQRQRGRRVSRHAPQCHCPDDDDHPRERGRERDVQHHPGPRSPPVGPPRHPHHRAGERPEGENVNQVIQHARSRVAGAFIGQRSREERRKPQRGPDPDRRHPRIRTRGRPCVGHSG
jgi:hypothetical protein